MYPVRLSPQAHQPCMPARAERATFCKAGLSAPGVRPHARWNLRDRNLDWVRELGTDRLLPGVQLTSQLFDASGFGIGKVGLSRRGPRPG